MTDMKFCPDYYTCDRHDLAHCSECQRLNSRVLNPPEVPLDLNDEPDVYADDYDFENSDD